MASKTQIKLAQLTGSLGTASSEINDQISAAASGSIASSDLSSVLSHMAGAIKRIHGDASFSEAAAGTFSQNLVPASDGSYNLGSSSVEWATVNANALQSQDGLDVDAGSTLSLDGAGGINIGTNADVAVDIDAAALNIDASGEMAIAGTAGVSISSSEAAADAVVISASDASGGIDLSAGGSVVVSVDADSVDMAQQLNVDATTASTSSSTGALVVDGGMGLAGDAHLGGDLSLQHDAAELHFGADDDVKLTHVADAGLLLNDGMALRFRDADLEVKSSADGQLDVLADTEVAIVAPVVDIDASTAVRVSNDLELDSDAAVLKFGADSDVSLTHVADTGLLLNSGMAMRFRDADLEVKSSADGQIDVMADSVAKVTAPTAELQASTEILLDSPKVHVEDDSASLVFGADEDVSFAHDGSTGLDVTSAGAFDISAGAASQIDTSAGALTLDGAAGINLVGNASEIDITSTGVVDVNAATLDMYGSSTFCLEGVGNSAVKSQAALALIGTGSIQALSPSGKVYLSGSDGADSVHVASDMTVDGAVVLGSDLTVAGNLDVNGTLTTIDTANLAVEDSLIELNRGASSNANDLGFVFERGSTGDNAAIIWDESDDVFAVATTTADGTSTGNMSHDLATFRASKVEIDGTANHLDLDGSSNLTATAGGSFVVDSAGEIKLDADGGSVTFYDDSQKAMSIDMATTAGDAIFKDSGDAEIFRLDGSADSLLMAGTNKIEFGDSASFIHDDGDAFIIETTSGPLELSGSGVTLASADEIITLASGDIEFMKIRKEGGASNVILSSSVDNADIIFHGDDAAEVFRVDGDAMSLLMSGSRKVEFFDSAEFINSDGTDMTVGSGGDINLTATSDVNLPANVGLTFGDDGERIEGDGTELNLYSGRNFVFNSSSGKLVPSSDGSGGYSGIDLGQEAAGSSTYRSLMGSEISTTSDGGTQGTLTSSTSTIYVTDSFPSSLTDQMVSGATIVLGSWEGIIGSGGLGSSNADNFRSLAISSASGEQDLSNLYSGLYVRSSDYAAKLWWRDVFASSATLKEATIGEGYSSSTAIELSGSIIPSFGTSGTAALYDLGSSAYKFRTVYAGSNGSSALVASGSVSPEVDDAFDLGGVGAFSTSPSISVDGSQTVTSSTTSLNVSSLSSDAADALTVGAKLKLSGGGYEWVGTIGTAASSGDTSLSFSSATLSGGSSSDTSSMYETPQIAPFNQWRNLYVDGTAYLDAIDFNGTAISATGSEINLLDGDATIGSSVTIQDSDGMILNDGGTTKLIPMSDIKNFVGGGRSKVQLVHSGAISADTTFLYSGVSHDSGADPDLTDIYLNGQMMLSGTSAANGDYKIHGLAADGVQFFFALEVDDVVTIVKA